MPIDWLMQMIFIKKILLLRYQTRIPTYPPRTLSSLSNKPQIKNKRSTYKVISSYNAYV